MLARQQVIFDAGDDDLNELVNSTHLSKHFLYLARELEILEPKLPEDIYKSHLEQSIFFSFFFSFLSVLSHR